MRTAVTAAVMVLIASVASGNVRAYAIDPVRAEWSGKAHPVLGVSEILTCNFDSLSYVELFAGAKGAGGAYTATVFEGNTQLMTSLGDTVLDHGWVKFENWNTQVAFTKGKLLTVKFTRGGSDGTAA